MLIDGTPGPTSFTLFTIEGTGDDNIAMYSIAQRFQCNRLNLEANAGHDRIRRHIRYGDELYVALPLFQEEAGLAPACIHCTHQLSCISGVIQKFTRDAVQDPGRLA